MSLHTKDLNIISGIETLTKELGPVETDILSDNLIWVKVTIQRNGMNY
jgi:hypothetical protein